MFGDITDRVCSCIQWGNWENREGKLGSTLDTCLKLLGLVLITKLGETEGDFKG